MAVAGPRVFVFKLILITAGVVFGGAFAEVTTRVYANRSDSWVARQLRPDPFAILVEAHGDFGYRPKPNRTLKYSNGTVATSNSLGFRGPPVAARKQPGTVRIILLGGSTTHGWGVNDDETIDQYMRAELARRYPTRSFEIINLAYDGYDSYQLFERLRSDGLGYDPDFVIVNTGVNDVRNARYPDLRDRDPRTMLWISEVNRARAEQERGGPTLWTRLKHFTYLARVPATTRAATRLRAQQQDTVVTPQPDALDYFEKNLERMLDLVRGSHAVVLLSSEPSSLLTKYQPDDVSAISYWIGTAATTQAYRDSLDGRLRRVVDSGRARGDQVALIPYQTLDPSLFLDDAHLTAQGNQRLAQTFADAVGSFLQ
jgi:lysophospholipase L1-like esterase